MQCICFDLETTDLSPAGQILQFAFVSFNSMDGTDPRPATETMKKLAVGKIKIENTQLPMPRAILANHIDVLEHQNNPDCMTEKEAMLYIKDAICSIALKSREPVMLFGYNSIKFDLPYLRTSMIRNGISPYIRNVVYSDLLFLVKYLASTDQEIFNRLKGERTKLSLTLNNTYQTLVAKNDEYVQSHDAFQDVIETIKLSEVLRTQYNLNIATMNTYPQKTKDIQIRFLPNYEENPTSSSIERPMVLLDQNNNYALWIDLLEYQKNCPKTGILEWCKRTDYPEGGKSVIKWFNKKFGPFFIDHTKPTDVFEQLANDAYANFEPLYNLGNFFPPKNCDVECHIYELPINDIEVLENAIFHGNEKGLLSASKHAANLYFRYKFKNGGLGTSSVIDQAFSKYCKYRYHGKMKLDKNDTDSVYEEGVYKEGFHPTYDVLIEEIKTLMASSESEEDRNLMKSLLEFYNDSLIAKTLGANKV